MKGILWDGQWHSRRVPGLPANAVTGNPMVRALLIGVKSQTGWSFGWWSVSPNRLWPARVGSDSPPKLYPPASLSQSPLYRAFRAHVTVLIRYAPVCFFLSCLDYHHLTARNNICFAHHCILKHKAGSKRLAEMK